MKTANETNLKDLHINPITLEVGEVIEIRNSNEDTVAYCPIVNVDEGGARDILRAVNAHDELVKAARQAQNVIFAYKDALWVSGCDIALDVEKNLREAIAKAESL